MSVNASSNLASPESLRKGPSWSSLRGHERVATPPVYASDPKYKKYAQQVEKCLNTFDSVHEWADFISFLKQLLKTLEAYQQFKDIPRKVIVAKRLAQCLNPALPTGVHQRALDVYSHIFAVLGTEGLERDLALWSSGLFPFFEYAATSVKPTLLNLFDTYYLPMQGGLRPVMKSFILALLPGLEEETGEYFDKVLSLLDRVSGTVSQSFFFQNIWLVMLTTPSARGTSLSYLSRRLPVLKADEDIPFVVGGDVGLMVRAFAAALEDDDLLVRRGSLDLLLQSLRIDSVAMKRAQSEDRAILMRAATSVVLRRDLSLNRRLYSWLLGPDEHSQNQIRYLKENALELLSSTLRDEMFNPSIDYSPSRPFKIFISLLDKWEIGSPLTEALVFDAFKAIQKALGSGPDVADDLSMTASTLYEAVEPHLLWKQLFAAIHADVVANRSNLEGCRMVRYLLTTFHGQDEEIEGIHLPAVFAAIAELLSIRLQDDDSPISPASTSDVLLLLREILTRIPGTVSLKSRPRLSNEVEATLTHDSPLSFACSLYGMKTGLTSNARLYASCPFITIFEDFINISIHSAKLLSRATAPEPYREVLVESLRLLDGLVSRSYDLQDASYEPTWVPEEWLSTLLECMDLKIATFSLVDSVITAVITLHRANALRTNVSIDDRSTMAIMVKTLLKYLHSPWVAYHVRAVDLIWSLDEISRRRHVEAVIAETMSSQDSRAVEESCEVFGVLWRLTDDDMLPGARLKIPMMIILDTLRSDDPILRRVGETWMRCSLKSYLRVLDPILFDLYDPTIRISISTTEVNGKQLQGFSYNRPFDQHLINHQLETLLYVIKFGGQGFSKVTRTNALNRSPYGHMLQRLRSASAALPDTSYMDVLLQMLLRFLQSEPNNTLAESMSPFNLRTHAICIDLLQALVARGEVDFPALQTIESIVIRKLYLFVHKGRLDLQNKLLHLLHSVISASNPGADAQSTKGKGVQLNRTFDSASMLEETRTPRAESYVVHPLLIQTLLDGISRPTNHPILQHWLDFVLMTIPQYHESLQPVVVPLSDGLCRQLRTSLSDVRQASIISRNSGDITSITTDADFIMLLTAVERLVLLSLSKADDIDQVEDDQLPEKPNQESSGLLGYVSNVFSSDTTTVPDGQSPVRSSDNRTMYETVRVLYGLWDLLSDANEALWTFSAYSKTRMRCRKVLEHLFRAHSTEVLESVVDCWQRDQPDGAVAFEIVDILASNAQTVVHMLCESICSRLPGLSDRPRRSPAIPQLIDAKLFEFLERYFRQLEGPLALQVWGRFILMAKDVTSSMREFRVQAFATVKCFTVIADKICQTTALEDRRMRKELQDTYSKLLDLTVLANRPYDSGSWIRRPQKEALSTSGRESPLLRAVSDTKLDEKMNASSTSLSESSKPAYGIDLIEQVNLYIASSMLPNMRKFLVEGDKIVSACNSVVYNVVNPALKGKTRPLDVDESVLSILQEMTRIGAAIKAWRSPVSEAFNDNRCFNSTPDAGGKWKGMVKALFDVDKTSLSELLGKITTAPSANIFTNREYEMLLRSLNMRRLSYVLLSSEKNHFLTQLPAIQEKLVDTLRNVSSPVVQSEVYLCVRVLLCRLSPHNLSSFWPVILTELYRLFDQVLTSLPSDGAEELNLVLATCKLLDLLLVLQTEEFQIHQWIFITDTADAIYRPDDWLPDAMLDRLAEVTGSLPLGDGAAQPLHVTTPTPMTDNRPMRRPMLRSLRQIDSIRDLVPFFSSASIASYESVYSSGGLIDWEAVEQGLLEDMFDGR